MPGSWHQMQFCGAYQSGRPHAGILFKVRLPVSMSARNGLMGTRLKHAVAFLPAWKKGSNERRLHAS